MTIGIQDPLSVSKWQGLGATQTSLFFCCLGCRKLLRLQSSSWKPMKNLAVFTRTEKVIIVTFSPNLPLIRKTVYSFFLRFFLPELRLQSHINPCFNTDVETIIRHLCRIRKVFHLISQFKFKLLKTKTARSEPVVSYNNAGLYVLLYMLYFLLPHLH